ncbi:MAG: hypothetical protein OEY13_06545 [Gammaproteobacteria bacterium]|nr:hypothetical protein [Gammaproteobacteria bacterium]MDH4312841.1 hypothetical protein [Gammaproteobacteria bacterium]MDH5272718.1 hypothetical protein [Gammaproteobacteria bacterium]
MKASMVLRQLTWRKVISETFSRGSRAAMMIASPGHSRPVPLPR